MFPTSSANMGQHEITIRLESGGEIAFDLTEDALTLSTGGKRSHSRSSGRPVQLTVPYRQVINASFKSAEALLHVAFLARNKDTRKYYLYRYYGLVNDVSADSVSQWVETLMQNAYEGAGIRRSRRLRVLLNPFGGIGKAAIIFSKKIEPILRTAGCILDVTMTTHNGHAYEIAKELSIDDYDVLVTVSGDGLVHEVINGFADHSNPQRAFNIPVAPIPCGSGNGLSLNLLGGRDGFDVALATLNAIKGLPMQVDAFSVVQNNRRTISFMSQALGLMADLDLGTEHLRWMGDTRFTLGLLYGILLLRPCPVRLSYKGVETDKSKMIEALQARRARGQHPIPTDTTSHADIDGGLPPSTEDEDEWTTFEEPLLYVYAGKGPYVGRSYMAFPVSVPDDGLIDIVAMPAVSRSVMLRALAGAAKGDSFWLPKLHYIKARAYRIEALKSRGNLSVDGEAMPFENFQVEVQPKLATLLSLYGYYVADFPPSEKKRQKKSAGN